MSDAYVQFSTYYETALGLVTRVYSLFAVVCDGSTIIVDQREALFSRRY